MPPSPQSPTDLNRVNQARFLRGLASGSQIVAMVALFVMWKQLGWPFWKAFEVCLVAGVALYTLLFGAASVLMVLARVQPAALLVTPVMRMVCVVIYGVLRYVKEMGVLKSTAVLAVLYVAAWALVRRVEGRARRRFGW